MQEFSRERTPMTTLTVMTWNVQNLFLPGTDSGPDSPAAFDAKLASLASVIDSVRPDVLALQEVGPDGALDALQSVLARPMPYAVEGTPDARATRVAILSTLSPADSLQFGAFPPRIRAVQARDPVFDRPDTPMDESLTATMGRGAVEVTLAIDGRDVTVLTAHFKSKLMSYAREPGLVAGSQFQPNDEGERYRYAAFALYRRCGEAVTVRQRLNELLTNSAAPRNPRAGLGRERRIVFCGDLNDEAAAATTQILQGPAGSEIGTAGFAQGDQGDGYRLWNLAPLLPTVGGMPAYTRRYRGRGELIDHCLASHALVNPRRVPTCRTLHMPDPLPNMGDDPNMRRNLPGSDHAAVVAEFEV